jgi:UDP-glucose 4-epimerase
MKEPLLITGGAGYIGSHVVRQLSEAGYDTVIYDNLSTGSPQALIYGETLEVGDLADTERLRELFATYGFKTVLHFAASIIAPESVSNPLAYYANNTRNTLNLLQACVAANVRQFIFSSTAAVYGMVAGGLAGEDSLAVPINPYGASKLMSEQMLKDASAAHGMNHVILRYFNVAGADPLGRMGQRVPDATHLIKVCCQAALGYRSNVTIFGTDYDTADGTGIRDYIHIEDLASAHLAGLKHLQAGGSSSTFNVGYGRGASVRDVIDVVKSVSGVDFSVMVAPRRPGDPAELVARADKIRLLGWLPRYDDLQKIVADAFAWEDSFSKASTR